MLAPEPLRPAPKAPGSFDRCVPLEHTLALIPQLRERFGITRVADITHLDRVGIPVMSAIVPDSPDDISVYNGKGPTRESALAGAVMEAVERQAAAAPAAPAFRHDAGAVLSALDPEHGAEPLRGATLDVVQGVDVLTGDPVLVPCAMVQCPWPGDAVLFNPSTNGLAAGNTFAEAVYHAVFELVERHLYAIAHAKAHLRPLAVVSQFAGKPLWIPQFVDDPVAFDVALPCGRRTVDELTAKIVAAGLRVRLRVFEHDDLPPLFVATIADECGGPSAAHTGFGCSWSPEHAAIRALTEAAQSRAADFLGAREDLWRHDEPNIPPDGMRRTFGVPSGRWFYDAPAPTRGFGSVADRSSADVAGDLDALFAALRRARAGRVVVVDLTPPGLPVRVVRAIAPRLETPASRGAPGPAVRAILDLDREPHHKESA